MYKISISPEEIESMGLVSFPGVIHVITHPGRELNYAVSYLKRQKIIGFDTETRPVFSPGQRNHGVALLQLSGSEEAFLFRVQSLGMRRRICAILSNPDIIKVGAASHDDVRSLQRLRFFEEKGFVDLQKIGWEWGIRDKSVKKMAAIILGVRISKTQQLSNWEAETLSEAQQKYAATDAWICREMYLRLLASEKHPLTPDERLAPADLLQRQQAQAAALERRKKAEEAAAANGEKKKRRRHRGGRNRKKKQSNGEADPKEGA